MKKLISLMIVLYAAVAYAGVPQEISYQGKLKEYGAPVTGTRTVNFKIYSAESGPGLVWESGNVSVIVSSGVFTHTLTPVVDWRLEDIWIETVISGKTLVPREKLTAQAFALHAKTAEGISKPAGETIDFTIGSTHRASLSSSGEFSTLMNGTTFYLVPRGAIIMWAGALINIPFGWVLCDGDNGTPDLRDKFIVGAGLNYPPGNTGGSSTHQHNNITINYSSVFSGNNGGHSHKLPIFEEVGLEGVGFYVPRKNCSIYGQGSAENTSAMKDTVGFSSGGRSIDSGYPLLSSNAGVHGHDISHGHSSGHSDDASNIPEYYALVFIMKR